MDELMSKAIDLVRYTSGFSRLNTPSLCIKLDSNAIFVNDITYEFNNESFSKEDISYILSQFRKMGAVDYKHAEDAVVFTDASLLLQRSRN